MPWQYKLLYSLANTTHAAKPLSIHHASQLRKTLLTQLEGAFAKIACHSRAEVDDGMRVETVHRGAFSQKTGQSEERRLSMLAAVLGTAKRHEHGMCVVVGVAMMATACLPVGTAVQHCARDQEGRATE